MHIHTIVKVRANTPQDAIKRVTDLLTGHGEYSNFGGASAFDWFDQEGTAISGTVKTEHDFEQLRKEELADSEDYIKDADNARGPEVKGFYLQMAGECLQQSKFWSITRRAFDHSRATGGTTVYYVETDRHA